MGVSRDIFWEALTLLCSWSFYEIFALPFQTWLYVSYTLGWAPDYSGVGIGSCRVRKLKKRRILFLIIGSRWKILDITKHPYIVVIFSEFNEISGKLCYNLKIIIGVLLICYSLREDKVKMLLTLLS